MHKVLIKSINFFVRQWSVTKASTINIITILQTWESKHHKASTINNPHHTKKPEKAYANARSTTLSSKSPTIASRILCISGYYVCVFTYLHIYIDKDSSHHIAPAVLVSTTSPPASSSPFVLNTRLWFENFTIFKFLIVSCAV